MTFISEYVGTPPRQVYNLLYARRTHARPLPRANSIPSKLGISYEKSLFRALQKTCAKQNLYVEFQAWFEFEDHWGPGLAAVDFLIEDKKRNLLIVAEAKLTYRPEAETKLRYLYMPVVEKALGKSVSNLKALVICKNLTSSLIGPSIDTLEGAFHLKASVPTLQWLGRGPIL